VWCVILCDTSICTLCLIVVPLPPRKNPFAVEADNNNNNVRKLLPHSTV
jgi:hypothetical protein